MTPDPRDPVPRSALSRRRPPLLVGGEWLKIILMGVFLAGLLYVTVFYEPTSTPTASGPPVVEDSTPPPEIDPDTLALARDKTRTERLVTETGPLKHLLEKSLQVTPSVALKLDMPEQSVPTALLRGNPEDYRGRYLWYKGRLEYLSKPKAGHPVQNYSYYEGRLKTTEGEQVVFAFSVPPPPDLVIGDWVRMEGFFLKLRDAHLPVSLDQAPMLVGPELFRAYADWDAVEQFDPAILARLRDGEWTTRPDGSGEFVDADDMDKTLADSQDVPLWHLASYAMSRDGAVSDEAWRAVPAFVTKEQFEKFRHGEIPRGTPMRLLGTFVWARIHPARVNPLGVEAWTQTWIQVRDLGGKVIPVWIPNRIGYDWQRNQTVECHAYFFRRYRYKTLDGEERWTPLFVAARLNHFNLTGDPLSNAITLAFAGLAGVVGIVFFVMARRDRRQRERHEVTLVERRRRRRTKNVDAADEQPCTP